MTRFRLTLLASLLAASTAWVASAALPRVEKAKVELLADRTSYAAGSRAQIAAVLDFEAGWHTNSHKPTFEYLIPTSLELALPAGWAPPAVDYPQGEAKTFAFADQPLSVYDGKVVILARLAIPAATPAGNVAVGATVVYQACDHEQCLPPVTKKLSLELPVGSAGAPQHEALFAAGPTTGAPKVAPLAAHGKAGGLGWTLLFAFLGGLILNAMPCVLPVVSLKIFGLVRSAGAGRRVVAASGIATALGILVSFWGLALAAILARTAGAAVGWGIQFQNPVFVTFLLVVVELFCLNLWGVFEIPLPGSLAQAGGHSEGMAGHFTTGLFATLMATPCSAPFLGTALGFALGQSALTIAVTFTAIALGFASPYLLLAAAPRLAARLPRPGAWMDTLRGLMGFLLAASAVWLLYVLSAQVDAVRLALVELALVALALVIWLGRRARQGGAAHRASWALFALLALATLWLPTTAEAPGANTAQAAAALGSEGIPWQPFDQARAERLASEGKLVFVDVTAEWCFTCKFNEKRVLASPEVVAAFQRLEVEAMRADWTNRNEEIGRYLASFGRYGIPFYALYRPGTQPYAFSELLTRQGLLDALAAAGKVAENR